jgi:hypothetical protein
MNVKGKVKVIFDEQVISEKFKKREFVVIDDSSQYPQELLIQTTQDKTSLLDELSEGQYVDVSINLRGRMWTNKEGVDKYFNTIEAWKIDFVKQEQEEPKDDLPF